MQKDILKVMAMLWSSVYDLLLMVDGSRHKPLDQIKRELEQAERLCRRYAEECQGECPHAETCRPP